jgi:alpha-1,2-mannosyltransferase
MWLGFEAMAQLIPDVFIDTMGYAFTFPIVRLFSKACPIGAYVHYPVISTDMLRRVEQRQKGHTNAEQTANSWLRTTVKLAYYRVFARLYTLALRRADTIVVNGTWTKNHIDQLLGIPTAARPSAPGDNMPSDTTALQGVAIVYPPCDTAQLAEFPLAERRRWVVSLAQFRPEKEHTTQLYILKALLDQRPDLFTGEDAAERVRLVMVGSARNAADERRIALLRVLAEQLGVAAHVELVVNADYAAVRATLAAASVGLSTMRDEHFGINVVEFMAAGLVPLVHRSGGPWLDIARPVPRHPLEPIPTGFHAVSIDDFATQMAHIFDMDDTEVLPIRTAARQRALDTFGRNAFTTSWDACLWQPLRKAHTARARHA